MKKFIFFIILFTFCFGTQSQSNAQTVANNTPCTASFLSPNANSFAISTANTGTTYPSCDVGTSLNYYVFVGFRPAGNSMSFSLTTTGCTGGCGTGLQIVIRSGTGFNTNCVYAGSVIECRTGNNLSFTTTGLDPCQLHFLAIQGVCNGICSVKISYNPDELLKNVPKPIVSGPTQVCLNTINKYSSSAGSSCDIVSDYKWSLIPSNAGTVTKITGTTDANVKITNLPANGKVQLKVEPIATGKGIPATVAEIIDIDVINLKPATCKVDICAEERPFVYDLATCVKTTNPTFTGTIAPSVFTINLPPGTKKIQTFNYTVDGAGCGSSVTLDMQVFDNKAITLTPLLLCEGESKAIKGNIFTCADAKTSLNSFVKNGAPKPIQCDSNFKILVQCLKINPKITGIGALDCSTTQLTLNAATSTTLPSNVNNTIFQGIGTRQYVWSKNGVLIPNATASTLIVTSSGLYEVAIIYTYQVTQVINNQQVIVSKTCTKTASAQINGTTNMAVAETPIASTNPCVNGNVTYSVMPDPNAQSYQWSVTNGAIILGSATNPNQVTVKNNGLPYDVCLVKTACNLISAPSCISITPTPAPVTPIIVGKNPVCLGDSALYKVNNANLYSNNVTYKWTITNGTISNFSSDSSEVYIKWISTTAIGKIKVKVRDICGMSIDSINVTIKNCNCGANAGTMAFRYPFKNSNIITHLIAYKPTKILKAKHQSGTETLGTNDTYAFVLHEGNQAKIVKPIKINKTGAFAFDSLKMSCNKIYYVSYVVGNNVNGVPNLNDTCLSVVPIAQPVVWLCKIKNQAAAREYKNNTTQFTDYQINIYPNPTNDNFFIEIPKTKNVLLDLYNTQGQLVLSQKEMIQITENQYEANVAHLPKGVYLLKMNLDGKVEVRKVVVQ